MPEPEVIHCMSPAPSEPELPNESNELLDYEAIYDEIFDNIDKSAKQISNALLGLGKKWRTHLDDLPDDITLVVIKKVA